MHASLREWGIGFLHSRITRYTDGVKQEIYGNEIYFWRRDHHVKTAPLTSRELRQTVHCLELYYRKSQSQKDIAQSLGVSAATVSRLLKRAFDEGLVRVELDLPRREQLEAGLGERFGLRDAVVGAAGGRGDVKEEVGTAAAAHFEKIAPHGPRGGVSGGVPPHPTSRHPPQRRLCDPGRYP